MMSELTLFAFPGSCSRVSMILLEEAKASYQIKMVKLTEGEHKKPAYLAINPKGKVPTLRINDQVLTENPVIISFINKHYAQANLLPIVTNEIDRLSQLSDLCFCSSTLHPLVTRFCKPEFFTTDSNSDNVKQKAIEAINNTLLLIEERMAQVKWWYGTQWSALDAYIFWVLSRLESAGFALQKWPNLQLFLQTMLLRPSVKLALDKEKKLS